MSYRIALKLIMPHFPLYSILFREKPPLVGYPSLQAHLVAAINQYHLTGRPLIAEFSPVTDFREAVCKQFEQGECLRGGYCNFMHVHFPSRDLSRRLFRKQRPARRSRSRSKSRERRRSRSRSPRCVCFPALYLVSSYFFVW